MNKKGFSGSLAEVKLPENPVYLEGKIGKLANYSPTGWFCTVAFKTEYRNETGIILEVENNTSDDEIIPHLLKEDYYMKLNYILPSVISPTEYRRYYMETFPWKQEGKRVKIIGDIINLNAYNEHSKKAKSVRGYERSKITVLVWIQVRKWKLLD